MASDRALPLAKLDDVNPDMGDCSEVYEADEGVAPRFSIFALPRSCHRNRDGLHCVYPDAVNPTICLYCSRPFQP